MRYVIIGNGVAGTTAAEQIRKVDAGATVRILTDETFPFYSRIRLPEFLAGETDEQGLIIRTPAWYSDNRIELSLSTTAASIMPTERTVVTGSGEHISYDRLLLATGARCFVPPITGADMPGVFTLRTLADAVAIRRAVTAAGSHVALIGGGVLGLEAGYGLQRAGCRITVIEVLPRLLPRQMDNEGAAVLQRRLEDLGFTFHIGTAPASIAGTARAERVELEDGRRVDCSAVIISAGIRNNVQLAALAGAATDRGVIVNDRMETSLAGVYAAGDLVQHKGQCYGIWPAAQEQGNVAGIAMAGGTAAYRGTTVSNSLTVAGIDIFSAGDIDAGNEKGSILRKVASGLSYGKLVLEGNVITGAILLGDVADRGHIMKAIREKSDVSGLKNSLSHWDFSGR